MAAQFLPISPRPPRKVTVTLLPVRSASGIPTGLARFDADDPTLDPIDRELPREPPRPEPPPPDDDFLGDAPLGDAALAAAPLDDAPLGDAPLTMRFWAMRLWTMSPWQHPPWEMRPGLCRWCLTSRHPCVRRWAWGCS